LRMTNVPLETAEAEIARLQARIAELEEGGCRFNCRTARNAFIDGYNEGHDDAQTGDYEPENAYDYWKKD